MTLSVSTLLLVTCFGPCCKPPALFAENPKGPIPVEHRDQKTEDREGDREKLMTQVKKKTDLKRGRPYHHDRLTHFSSA